jgi:sulfur carrier protein
MMKISVNGNAVEVAEGWSVGDLVRSRADATPRVAVARNGEVVPRGEWEATRLVEGDLLEVLAAVAGG